MTAVTIDSGVDLMRFDGCTRYQQSGITWGIEGIDGWDGTPAVRESPVARPQADGSYMPSRLTTDHRVLTLRCFVKCTSSLETALLKDRVSNLMARRLTVSVEEPTGTREVTGFLSGDPASAMAWWDQALRFSLIITCPDPLKYGPPLAYEGDGSDVVAANTGMLPVWPAIRVTGMAKDLTLEYAGHQVVWSGPADGMTLDFADMVPSAGIVTKDDAFRLPVGESTVRYSITAGATLHLTVRPAWR